jgi:hypothetical protein
MQWGKFHVYMANSTIHTTHGIDIAAGAFFEFDGETLRLMDGSEYKTPSFRAAFDLGWFQRIQAPGTQKPKEPTLDIPTIDKIPAGWMEIGAGWTLAITSNTDADFELAMKVAKGAYQDHLLTGHEALSGSTLKGTAKRWSSKYAASRDKLLKSLTAAGVPWMKVRHKNRVLLVIGRNFPGVATPGLSTPTPPVVGSDTGSVEPLVLCDVTDTVADLFNVDD